MWLMEEGTEGFEIVRNSTAEVGLDTWRQQNHGFDPMNPLRNNQLLQKLMKPAQIGFDQVSQALEKIEQQIRRLKPRFGDDIEKR